MHLGLFIHSKDEGSHSRKKAKRKIFQGDRPDLKVKVQTSRNFHGTLKGIKKLCNIGIIVKE